MSTKGKKKRILFTPEQITKAQEMDEAGITQPKIAKAMGVSIATFKRSIRPLLRHRKVKIPKVLIDADAAGEVICFMRSVGLDSKAISRVFKCSEDELVRRFAYELDTAESQVISQMATIVFNSAIAGNEAAARWWLDRRGGEAWRPKPHRHEIKPILPSPDSPTVEDKESARRANVRELVAGLSPEARAKLQEVVDEARSGKAKLLN